MDAAEIDRLAGSAPEAMAVPYDDEREMPEQDRGSTRRELWDFAASAGQDAYPLHKNVPYFDLYRKQVAKQADLVLALHWCGERFSLAEKAAAFAYYEGITVATRPCRHPPRRCSPPRSATWTWPTPTCARRRWSTCRTAKRDTEDGLHMASLAGAWIALVCGFGGLRDHDDRLRFAPRLPPGSTGWPSR